MLFTQHSHLIISSLNQIHTTFSFLSHLMMRNWVALRSNETPAYKFLTLLNLWVSQNLLALLSQLFLMMHIRWPDFIDSLTRNETDLKASTLFEFHGSQSEDVRHLYEIPGACKEFCSSYFTRRILYSYTSYIFLPHSSGLRDNKTEAQHFRGESDCFWVLDVGSLASFADATFLRIVRRQIYKANSLEIEMLDYVLSLYPSLTKSSEHQSSREKPCISRTGRNWDWFWMLDVESLASFSDIFADSSKPDIQSE